MAWVREGLFRAPRLGVRYAAASLVVEEVEPGSGAEAAGVRAGDLVRSVAGKPVSDRPDVLRALAARSAGEVVPVGIERNGRARVLRIRLAPPFPAVFPTPAP